MNAFSPVKSSYLLLVIVGMGCHVSTAQAKSDWLRVITGEVETIDVDRTSLRFTPNDTSYSAVFRTTLATPSEVPSRRGVEYVIRLDTIEFGDGHRVIASRFLNTKNAEIHSVEDPNAKSKRSWGRASTAMRNAVTQLSPFGIWRITEYRFATGEKGSDEDEIELKALIGSSVWFRFNSLLVGDKSCKISEIYGKQISDTEAKAYFDTTLSAIGIDAPSLNAVRFDCVINKEPLQRTLLLPVSREHAIMLWDGVFLDLRRSPTEFVP